MHPDLPSPGGSGPDPLEQLLRTLPVPALPSTWRTSILGAAAPPTLPPFFTKSFLAFMTTAWGLIAVLHFTTPAPSPAPANLRPPSGSPLSHPPADEFGDPWLAQLQNPSALLPP